MTIYRKGCIVCGKDLVYLHTNEPLTCVICGEVREANARCEGGHYICDTCHSAGAMDVIERLCSATDSTDPMMLAVTLMHHPSINMHGPEHHFLVPAVLLAAFFNAKGETEKKAKAVHTARERARTIPGGHCGFFGDCGAAVGTGIFMSIATGATPLSKDEWRLANLMTSKALKIIAEHGGPRCCKRVSFLAIQEAVKFAKKHLGVSMRISRVVCEFPSMNKECRGKECPFHAKHEYKSR